MATFAQAIRSTRLTAPNITSNDLRASPNNGVAQGFNGKSVLGPEGIRVAAAELIGCHLQEGIGLGQGHAGLEPPGGFEIVALVGAIGIELKGKQNVCFRVGDKGFVEDADDGVRLIAQGERGSDNIRIAAKFALP